MQQLSGTYNFQSVQVELLIREAYENIGIAPEFITPQKLESARRSVNLILIEWMNKSTNLWTLQDDFIAIKESKSTYLLNKYVSDITEVNLRTSERQLNGTAESSNGGVAANAFDGNSATACTQDAPDGNISYDYGEGQAQKIDFIGTTSNQDIDYSLVVENSADGVSWNSLLQIPKQKFTKSNLQWFDIPTPTNARYYRIRETGGATLNISEIYFNNNVLDTTISSISRDEYLTFPQKNIKGRPSVYYFDKAITPSIYLWPSPSASYNAISFSYKKMMQDVGLYTNTIEIPSRFYPALTAALSYKLAIKFNPQIVDVLSQEYQNSFNLATTEDTEDVNITIRPEWH